MEENGKCNNMINPKMTRLNVFLEAYWASERMIA